MRRLFVTVPVGLVLLAAVPAVADDIEIIDAPEVDISANSEAANWYARADFGYAAAIHGSKPDYTTFDGAGYDTNRFDSARLARPFSVSGGVGYQLTDVFRADVTADFFTGDLSGTSSSASRCSSGEPSGTGCSFSHAAEYDSTGVMANAYADLVTIAGFTPYVGAGLGVARVSWDRFETRATCTAGGAACSGTVYGGQSLEGDAAFRFSYAVMAGVSYAVTDRIKLDAGYRYSDIAGGDISVFQASGAQAADHGFSRHEVRVGLRVSLW